MMRKCHIRFTLNFGMPDARKPNRLKGLLWVDTVDKVAVDVKFGVRFYE